MTLTIEFFKTSEDAGVKANVLRGKKIIDVRMYIKNLKA